MAELCALLLLLAKQQRQIGAVGIKMLLAAEGSETRQRIERPTVVDVMVDVEHGSPPIALYAELISRLKIGRTVGVAVAILRVDAME